MKHDKNQTNTDAKAKAAFGLSSILRKFIPVAIIGGGIAICAIFIATAPKPKQKPQTQQPQLVSVTVAHRTNHRVVVKAMGTVVPSKRIVLKPRVSGQLIGVSDNFVPGGRFGKGETIVKIDQRDYELLVKQRSADVVRARHDLKIELGQQIIAKREYELMRKTSMKTSNYMDRDLILRKPQLELANARIGAAQASLDKANLDLKRTIIPAPFNAVILDKQQVDLGSQVSPATQIAVLANTDEYWVLASLPISKLKWLNIPNESNMGKRSSVRIFNKTSWPATTYRTGQVLGLLNTLETKGRLARVLISVKDPLCLASTKDKGRKLLVGMYVSIEADGVELKNAICINRTSLRDNDTVWVFDKNDQLEIRSVQVLWRARDVVYIGKGLEDGERIVSSDLAIRVPGSPLKLNAPTSQPGVVAK